MHLIGYTANMRSQHLQDIEKRFRLLSPLDNRYYFANQSQFEALSLYLSEEAQLQYCVKVELALLKELGAYFTVSPNLIEKSIAECSQLNISEIIEVEEKTHHQIRALITVLKKHVDPSLRHMVHLGATSSDILDTAHSLRIKHCFENIILPQCIRMQETILTLIRTHAHTPQIGRTHGQFAVPMTYGHFFAEYASRLGNSLQSLIDRSKEFVGQLSGAIGTYTAFCLFHDAPRELETRVITSLGLKVSEHSTQIASPEPLARFFLELNIYFSILANLVDDIRNLQRSEIGELYEFFESEQDGSSAMPHKKNPWNAEHIKSMFKYFSPHIQGVYSDLISEHQRDLTNSASKRFYSEYIAGFFDALIRTHKLLESLRIDTNNSAQNLALASEHAYTEVFYILLAASGHENAHTLIKKAFFEAKKQQKNFVDYLEEYEPSLLIIINKTIESFPAKHYFQNARDILKKIASYSGLSSTNSMKIAQNQQEQLDIIKQEYTITNDENK